MQRERVHRKYSPSQAERVFGCHGSTNLLARVPARPPSVYAEEGTDAHEVVDAALKNSIRDAKEAHRGYSTVFAKDLDDGTNEFYLSVQIMLDHVYSIIDAYPDAVTWFETFVDPPLEAAPGEAGGYCDVCIYVPSIRTLFVIDYKHGAGVAKAAKGNKQIFQYAGGFLFGENPKVDANTVSSVVLTIVQPRAYHEEGIVREHEVTPYEVFEYLEDLNEVVTKSEKPDAPLTPDDNGLTTDHCRFCDARTVCPAREAAALKVANSAFAQIGDVRTPDLPAPNSLDLQRLGLIRFHSGTLRKWLDDVDAHCEELMRQGFDVPGAKLVEVNPRRKWYGSEEEVAEKLAAMIGLDDTSSLFRTSLIPITSAEKLVTEAYKRRVGRGRKKKAAENGKQAFAYLTLKQTSGNLVVVDESDPRPAVNKSQQAFGQVQGILPPPTNT